MTQQGESSVAVRTCSVVYFRWICREYDMLSLPSVVATTPTGVVISPGYKMNGEVNNNAFRGHAQHRPSTDCTCDVVDANPAAVLNKWKEVAGIE